MQFDIKREAAELFGNITSFEETAGSCTIKIKTCAKHLPEIKDFRRFIESIPNRDILKIDFEGMVEKTFRYKNQHNWMDEYSAFQHEQDEMDDVEIDLRLDKNCASNCITIYDFNTFVSFLSSKTLWEQIQMFSTLVQSVDAFLRFEVLWGDCELYTKYFSFSNSNDTWPYDSTLDRRNDLKKCSDSSVFLDRNDIKLLPQDFHILKARGADGIISIMERIETVLSYIFVSNTSYILNGKLVLSFDQDRLYEIDINNVRTNKTICNIFSWAYDCDTSVERAAIARNIIKIHCKTIEQLMSINENVFASIKSNYVIYQKDNSQQYLEVKNKISQYIVENVKQIQELARGVADGLRNNFIAVLSFVITAVLTGAINFDECIPKNLLFIFVLIVVISILYLILTQYTLRFKIRTIESQYNYLKENYRDILDERDIEIAFSGDKAYNSAINEVKKYCRSISLLWIIFIGIMIMAIIYMRKPASINHFIKLIYAKIESFWEKFQEAF